MGTCDDIFAKFEVDPDYKKWFFSLSDAEQLEQVRQSIAIDRNRHRSPQEKVEDERRFRQWFRSMELHQHNLDSPQGIRLNKTLRALGHPLSDRRLELMHELGALAEMREDLQRRAGMLTERKFTCKPRYRTLCEDVRRRAGIE